MNAFDQGDFEKAQQILKVKANELAMVSDSINDNVTFSFLLIRV